ncbi:MAG: hypothetical protein HY981_01445 [Candidatus Magasanikbacteria bacterium]|nr:hypothetical protein [Candidatus Magasanikbacteria bacterium]
MRAVRKELKRLNPMFCRNSFNWNQPAFRASREAVEVCFHALRRCAYNDEIIDELKRDGRQFDFQPGSIALLVTIVLQHPDEIIWPGAYSAMTFSSQSGNIQYFIGFVAHTDNKITIEIIRVKKKHKYDFGGGNGFVMQKCT